MCFFFFSLEKIPQNPSVFLRVSEYQPSTMENKEKEFI